MTRTVKVVNRTTNQSGREKTWDGFPKVDRNQGTSFSLRSRTELGMETNRWERGRSLGLDRGRGVKSDTPGTYWGGGRVGADPGPCILFVRSDKRQGEGRTDGREGSHGTRPDR